MKRFCLSFLFLTITLAASFAGKPGNTPKREFRGVWITTYANIDWPKRNQTPAQQQSALLTILDTHKATGINAVFLQVRSQCDALYESRLEPWTADLTGIQGKAPAPAWDPLAFAIEESHKRGMEFHAWINPYRAVGHVMNLSSFSPNHVARQHPEWLMAAGNLRTLNPGLRDVRNYIQTVIQDIVQRYDVDGIHFDDYFYPSGSFNDDAAYAADPRGFQNRADWRRDNVNLLIKQTDATIKHVKPWVKFGISPSGIYRNSLNPAIGTPTAGLEHYNELYADTKKWLQEGWIDYLAPQVYWYMGQARANYSQIVPWWNNNNYGRHMYIGLGSYKINDPASGINWANPSQIPNQIRFNRQPGHPNIHGQIMYNTGSMSANQKHGFRDSLRENFYQKPALLPTMPWRDNTPPASPKSLTASMAAADSVLLSWKAPSNGKTEFDKVRQYAIYRSSKPQVDWQTADNLVAITESPTFTDKVPDTRKPYYYLVTALDRYHNESVPSNITSFSVLPAIAQVQKTEKAAPKKDAQEQEKPLLTLETGAPEVASPIEETVVEKVAPIISYRNVSRTLQNGSVTITPTDVNDGTQDNDTPPEDIRLSLSQTDFTSAHLGKNNVTLTAIDKYGNTSTATVVVTIELVSAATIPFKLELENSLKTAPIAPKPIPREAARHLTAIPVDVTTPDGKKMNFQVLPFPNSSQMMVQFSLEKSDKKTYLEVYDSNGVKLVSLFSGKAKADELNKYQVNLEPWTGTLFYVRLTTSKKVYTYRLVRAE
ncbi:family 10 glycosylhydrolase [Nibribacter ruber]|uniref:Family 10 glycosylhydrolase n=1 Tax=Nibribacter ruber TaxID=2698458 RepID=A0A6P1NZE7_9BACT|nr:family 10 glycosylhydrolase [Nibribacter ruber]QHL87271.1 family 10 glycosylhydrolase [Nibribacter ruber]